MKKSTDYLELVVCHKYGSCYDYPSRMCVIRVPFDKLHLSANKVLVFDLTLSQVKKLCNIGFIICPEFYNVVPHRPCDCQFWQINNLNWFKFCSSFLYYINEFGELLPSVSSLDHIRFKKVYNFSDICSTHFNKPEISDCENDTNSDGLPF